MKIQTARNGKEVFEKINVTFFEFYSLVIDFQTSLNKYMYLHEDQIEKEYISIAWMMTFFGFNQKFNQYLHYSLTNKYRFNYNEFTFLLFEETNWNDIDDSIGDKMDIYQKIAIIKKTYPEFSLSEKSIETINYYKGNFDGYELILSHYLRHLFQTVKYINNQDEGILPYEKKYQLIKTLRAQLTTYEQAILFYNSLSPLGEVWERHPYLNSEAISGTTLNRKDRVKLNNNFITKYNLIKNMPLGFISHKKNNIDFFKFYPYVDYEFKDFFNDNHTSFKNSRNKYLIKEYKKYCPNDIIEVGQEDYL